MRTKEEREEQASRRGFLYSKPVALRPLLVLWSEDPPPQGLPDLFCRFICELVYWVPTICQILKNRIVENA